MRARWFLALFLLWLWARAAYALDGTLSLEITTPAKPAFSETVLNPEYEWREKTPLGRFSGYGFYERSDATRDWLTRNTISWAPFEKAPPLAAALEYGASESGDFWQGGAAFIASRLPPLAGLFDRLSLAYFTNIRGARFPSEWALHAEIESDTVLAEGVYRYRPSAERADDSGFVELWIKKPWDAIGLSLQKTGERWMPWVGLRLPVSGDKK